MIRKFAFHNKEYNLINNPKHSNRGNAFTVIVGKNGTGKSTLLSAIVSTLLHEYQSHFFTQAEIGFRHSSIRDLDLDYIPRNIIAVSSSPFDKFPITKKYNDLNNYTYLGLRDVSALNFGLSYMSKIITSLVQSIYEDHEQWRSLAEVLNYLDYEDQIVVKFNFNINKEMLKELFSEDFDIEYFFNYSKPFGKKLNKRFFLNNYEEFEQDKFNHLRDILYYLLNRSSFSPSRHITITINRYGIEDNNNSGLESNDLVFLLHSGVLSLRDIGLIKKGSGSIFSIKDSSSGEQSVILSILGIASHITDRSVICIDEPEVCLHPEWQEKYIQILLNTFKRFKNCHFIIATHSPQIVANLDNNNCYIVSMENAKTTDASQFINNSIDFQLANVFKSPGFKNEYLSRIAFTTFTKVGKNKRFDKEDILNYEILKASYKLLEDMDPVKELISVIKVLYSKYARY
ncbi:ATP-binding protein [Elizabethkingia anophelis]|nr:ATP-binding protein [Elizabethkingia anophelis]